MDIKKILVDQRKEYQKYLGSAVENFESHISLIAEALTEHTKQLQEHTKQLRNITEMVAQNSVDISDMKNDLQIIRGDLKQKADREELLLIERRVARLEHATAR